MKIIPAYIIKHLLFVFIVLLFLFAGLQLFISIFGELSDIGTGDYGIWKALMYTVLQVPNQLYTFIPIAGLVGSLIGMSLLAVTSELIVMRTAGVSMWQIVKAVLMAALVLMFVAVILGEVIAPPLTRIAEHIKTQAMSKGQTVGTGKGFWMHYNNSYINAKSINGRKHMESVSWFQFDKKGVLKSTHLAEYADLQDGQWQMHHVRESLFKKDHVEENFYDVMLLPVPIKAKLLGLDKYMPDELPIIKLYRYVRFRQEVGLNTTTYDLAFWQRIMRPLAMAVMIFLGLPFIFGPLRGATMGKRVVTGIVVGFVFYILNQILGPLCLVYQIPPFWAALVPIVLFLTLGLVLLRRC